MKKIAKNKTKVDKKLSYRRDSVRRWLLPNSR